MPSYPGQIPAMVPNVEQYAQFKANQEKAVAQHKAYSEQLEQKKGLLEKRAGDLDLADRLMKIMDSRVPKPARQFLSTQLAKNVGIDPKMESAKSVTQLLTSLDPDSLQALRTSFASTLSGAPPGQIQEQIRGVLTGQVDINALIGQIGSNTAPEGGAPSEETQQVAGGGGTDQLQGGPKGDMLGGESTTQKQPRAAVARPFAEGPGAVQSLEGNRTFMRGDEQASPQLVGALGLNSKTQYRTNDLIEQGFRVPFKAEDQEKLATNIAERSSGLSSTVQEAVSLVQMFEGKPETLGVVGQGVRSTQTILRQAEGLMNLIKPGVTVDEKFDPNSTETQGMVKEAAKTVMRLHKLDQTAAISAKIESSVLSMAYKMAIANDIPGNRLTNAILNHNIAQIGQSGSPEQFKSVLADTLQKTTREFDDSIRRQTGVSGLDIVTRGMTDKDILTASRSADILPDDLKTSLQAEARKRMEGGVSPSPAPSSPTLQEEKQTLGTLETQRKQREIEKFQSEQEIQRSQEERAQRGEVRSNEREQRMMEAQQANAARADAREERVTKAQEQSQALARESFEYRKQQDIKEENKAQSDKIGAAFRSFGAAIANSRSGGGGGISMPSNPAQDPGAFRIDPPPRRTPPSSRR